MNPVIRVSLLTTSFLFRRSRWPRVVLIFPWILLACGICCLVLGFADPKSLALRGITNPLLEGCVMCGIAIPGIIGSRIFVWLSSLPWLLALFAGLRSLSVSDKVGVIVVIVWSVLVAIPLVFAVWHEIRCAREA